MGIKKIARPINKAKNTFIEWLKKNDAEEIDDFEGLRDDSWTYYRSVSAFVGESLYVVDFMIWRKDISIDYSDGENTYKKMSVSEFLLLID